MKVRPAALVIGHPGHELRVFGWLGIARPTVFILTDGSGRSAKSRIESTSKILRSTGANQGSIYARMTDKEAYTALLNREFEIFTQLAEEMAESFAQLGVRYAAGDAIEGYNPIHDVCRLVLNAAAALAAREMHRDIATFDFALAGEHSTLHNDDDAISLTIDDDAFDQKMRAIRGYAELSGDADDLLARYGPAAFRFECLRPSGREAMDEIFGSEPPQYESVGEKRVAAGYYNHVIRYREHVRPLAEVLANLATA